MCPLFLFPVSTCLLKLPPHDKELQRMPRALVWVLPLVVLVRCQEQEHFLDLRSIVKASSHCLFARAGQVVPFGGAGQSPAWSRRRDKKEPSLRLDEDRCPVAALRLYLIPGRPSRGKTTDCSWGCFLCARPVVHHPGSSLETKQSTQFGNRFKCSATSF